MQRLALFDLDDTLIDRTAAYRRWADDLVKRRKLSADDRRWLYDVDLWEVPLWQQIPRIPSHFRFAEPSDEFWQAFVDAYPRFTTCEPETAKALDRLRQAGWKVGIVTNGRTDSQSAKIRLTGIDSHVDTWVISESEGVDKPALGIFEAAARQLNMTLADGGWMVGDNLLADIAGGRAAGLTTAWLHHGRTREPGDPRPTHRVDSAVAAVDLMLS